METIDFALKMFTPMGQLFWHAELQRLQGEIQAAEMNDADAAEASFRAALACATEQQAMGHVLRVATSYARLLCEQERTTEARSLLAPVYDGFTEGHDLPGLVDARVLLGEMPT